MEYINIKSKKTFNEFEELYAKILAKKIKVEKTYSVTGAIHRIRVMSDFSFIIIRTGRRLFQCLYIPEKSKFDVASLQEGYFITFKGYFIEEPRSKIGYDFIATSVNIIHAPVEPLPLVINKKEMNMDFDTILDNRPITLRNVEQRAVFKIQEGIVAGFREYFLKNGFTEFNSPKFVNAGAESGGAEMFKVEYFEKVAFLAQSPQIFKEEMVGVFDKVFTIGSVFRAEKSHTSRHITEFVGVDLEVGYIDSFYDIMLIETRAIKNVIDYLNKYYKPELNLLNVTLPQFESIPHIRFKEVKELIKKEYNRDFKSDFDLEPEEEKLIGDYFLKKYNSNFVFVTHYPKEKKPFYAMDDPNDPDLAFSFDLLLNGSEITTGGQRMHDYDAIVAKMQSRGMDIEPFSDYLSIHKYGIPPHGGLGIGLERLTMKLLKLDNIKQASCFPRDVDRLKP
jgi:nondiscriminating aspartyl-tRNA synthetase